jgi:hypothetical protein
VEVLVARPRRFFWKVLQLAGQSEVVAPFPTSQSPALPARLLGIVVSKFATKTLAVVCASGPPLLARSRVQAGNFVARGVVRNEFVRSKPEMRDEIRTRALWPLHLRMSSVGGSD